MSTSAHPGALSPAELASVVAGLSFGQSDTVFFTNYRAVLDGIVRAYRDRGHAREQVSEFLFEFREALISNRAKLQATAVRALETA